MTYAGPDLDTTFIRLRAVRRVNIFLFTLGLINGVCCGIAIGFVLCHLGWM